MKHFSESYFVYNGIGIIRTPYKEKAPYQPVRDDVSGLFYIRLYDKYVDGLKLLDTFKYIYVLYALDHIHIRKNNLIIHPPWANEYSVGIFASRSPNRPNPIGLSIVQIKQIKGNIIEISGIDAFDGTPVLDIKPYLKDLDAKLDANYGWAEPADDESHLLLHIKGIPHNF